MTKVRTNIKKTKSKALISLEYALLVLCLCIIALRTTFTETPGVSTSVSMDVTSGSEIWTEVLISSFSLFISSVLIFLCSLWLIFNLRGRKFFYRRTGLEIALAFFCLAAVISTLAAADKRAAVNNVFALLSPILMSLLLVQILDSQAKIKILLITIAALGVVSAYSCWEQYSINRQTIEFYQRDPNAILAQQQITPNSLEHFQFEHRLNSMGIDGFFTTSNSAGSFALLTCFAAVALFLESLKNLNSLKYGFARLTICGLATAVIISGLVITKSKGAIGATIFATAMFSIYLRFHNQLKPHIKKVLVGFVLLAIFCSGVIIWYGLNHGRLPGGNSMLVRWQYWYSSVQMFAEHSLTGVGPGNFADFYTHYKIPAALETVQDPHNFVLSILTQYGPLGLIGFLVMIAMPVWRILSRQPTDSKPTTKKAKFNFKKPAVISAIFIFATLLFIRPIIFPIPNTATDEERFAGIIILYIIPAIVFVIGFVSFTVIQTSENKNNMSITTAALFCAVLGFILHNLIDFAIFEPSVYATFWAVIAVLIAIDLNTKPTEAIILTPTPRMKLVATAVIAIAFIAFFSFTLLPVAKSTTKIKQADRETFDQAHTLFDSAAIDDPLNPAALSLNGKTYLQQIEFFPDNTRQLLIQAEICYLKATKRNSADFNNYERLTEIYMMLSEIFDGQDKTDWLNKAFDAAQQAIIRYPGCGRLHFSLAQIAEQLNKTDTAIEHYQKTIEIEDQYRDQFRLMYPEMENVVSRIGDQKYQTAIAQLQQLSTNPDTQ